ncbi:hypothetical protein [Mycoplasmopsis gallinarum]|uniref:hypothetical protein n=1 Tax=Mycoplasmopsis gallinarum TaxID=29557 RepID=UPI0004867609|nr:hypothetical protein [Mycoplasmopsis gallinarum]
MTNNEKNLNKIIKLFNDLKQSKLNFDNDYLDFQLHHIEKLPLDAFTDRYVENLKHIFGFQFKLKSDFYKDTIYWELREFNRKNDWLFGEVNLNPQNAELIREFVSSSKEKELEFEKWVMHFYGVQKLNDLQKLKASGLFAYTNDISDELLTKIIKRSQIINKSYYEFNNENKLEEVNENKLKKMKIKYL